MAELCTTPTKARQPLRWPTIPIAALSKDEQLLKLADWYAARRMIPVGERGQQLVFEAAEHALAHGANNPPGLFVWRLRDCQRRWSFPLGLETEDRARRRLKGALGYLEPPEPRSAVEDVYL